ncbi:MAG: hypothetical protein AB8H86_22260 [Polyangiales bacterium]
MSRLFPLLLALVAFAAGASLHPPARAQNRPLELPSRCNTGDLVVVERGQLTCLPLPRCGEGEFLSMQNRRLQCVGGSQTGRAVRGLLPECREGDTLVSEGFGRWRCSST